MADNVPLKLEFDLQKLSIIAVATKIWGSPLIKQKRAEYFKETVFGCSSFENFTQVTYQVLQQLEGLPLPRKIRFEAKDTIRLIGEKLYLWTWHVKNLGLDLKHAENISWTCYGTVDEAKTFQLYWENDPGLIFYEKPETIKRDFFNYSFYSISCMFGQEPFVLRNSNLMRKILKEICGEKLKIPARIDNNSLITIWVCLFLGKYTDNGIRIYRSLRSRGDNRNAKMLSMCATAGYLNAFKYFEDSIRNDRNEHYFRTAKETSGKLPGLSKIEKLKDNYIEMIIFLINNMTVEKRDLFLRNNLYNVFSALIDAWPYQGLALQLFNYSLHFIGENEVQKLLHLVIKFFSNSSYQSRRPDEVANIIRHVLQKLLELTPEEIKRRTMWTYSKFELFHNLILASDFSTMDILLNDSSITFSRREIIQDSVGIFKSKIREGKLHLLNKYTEEFLFETEKKNFKNRFKDMLKEILEREDFVLADKLLDWMADSNEERVLLKKEIDSAQILTNFRDQEKFCLSFAEKLLNWQFDLDEEQKKAVKIAFRTDEFIRKEFIKIWSGYCVSSVEASKTKCSELMNFFFESDEIETFIRHHIIDKEDFIEFFCNSLSRPRDFESIDELLNYCGVSPDDVNEVKRKTLDDIEFYISVFGFQKKMFAVADAIVNWVVGNGEMKKTVIENFINLPAGRELCGSVYKSSDLYYYDEILLLFNVWIPCGNITEIMKFYSTYSSNDKSKIEELFRKLKRFGFITKNDLEKIFSR